MKQTYFLFFIIIPILIFCDCANPLTPDGGPRDKRSPQVDSTKSTTFSLTNFDDDRIVIGFDEWVRLKDANQQIIISPPLDKPPEIKIKGKSVVIKFKQDLRPNTTYTINFGDAVEDITEGNKALALRYIFSTGAYIDSLEVRGRIRDAGTRKPQEDVYAMLYKNLEDSVVYKQKPYYFARTNSNGEFSIKNLKEGEYKILALKDINFNYKLDAVGEQIGFADENVMLTDSFRQRIELYIFEEDQDLRLINTKATQYGRVLFQLNQSPKKLRIQHLTNERDFQAFAEIVADSVIYWFDVRDTLPEQQFVVYSDTEILDTVKVQIPLKTKFLEGKPKLDLMFRAKAGTPRPDTRDEASEKYERAIFSTELREIHPQKTAEIEFNHPIYEVDGTNILLLEDTLKTPVAPRLNVAQNDRRFLIVDYDWKDSMKYELLIPAGALTDIYGLKNDTLRLPYRVKKMSDYGNLDIIIDSLEADKKYLVELTTLENETLEQLVVTGGKSFEYTYESIETNKYIIRVVEDDNNNGKWDSGNYLEKRKPEKIYTKTVTEMRPNWDTEVAFSIKEKPQESRGNLERPGSKESSDERPDNQPKLNKGKN